MRWNRRNSSRLVRHCCCGAIPHQLGTTALLMILKSTTTTSHKVVHELQISTEHLAILLQEKIPNLPLGVDVENGRGYSIDGLLITWTELVETSDAEEKQIMPPVQEIYRQRALAAKAAVEAAGGDLTAEMASFQAAVEQNQALRAQAFDEAEPLEGDVPF
jgi:hypothetical protein